MSLEVVGQALEQLGIAARRRTEIREEHSFVLRDLFELGETHVVAQNFGIVERSRRDVLGAPVGDRRAGLGEERADVLVALGRI